MCREDAKQSLPGAWALGALLLLGSSRRVAAPNRFQRVMRLCRAPAKLLREQIVAPAFMLLTAKPSANSQIVNRVFGMLPQASFEFAKTNRQIANLCKSMPV
jgi:hypothetical protein